MNEPRKASDILLDLENKVDALSKDQKTLALSINVLTNKLTQVINALNSMTGAPINEVPHFQPQSIPVSNERTMEVMDYSKREDYPRTQRPETFAPTPMTKPAPKQAEAQVQSASGKVSVNQRIVDATGKAMLLANVEITNKSNGQVVHKGRTDGVGKYHCSLPVGEYLIHITKSEALNKAKVDVMQNAIIDGSSAVLTLPVMIIK